MEQVAVAGWPSLALVLESDFQDHMWYRRVARTDLVVVDTSDPAQPRVLSRTWLGPVDLRWLMPLADAYVVAAGPDLWVNLVALDISDPELPTEALSAKVPYGLQLATGSADQVAVETRSRGLLMLRLRQRER